MILGDEIKIEYNLFKERNAVIERIFNKYIPYEYSTLSFNVPFVQKFLFFFIFFIIFIISLLLRK